MNQKNIKGCVKMNSQTIDHVTDVAIKGILEVFANNYQYSINSVEQIRTDMCVIKFINGMSKDVHIQEDYFELYKELRK